MLSRVELATAASLACVLEASAEKPGNVTPTHALGATTYREYLCSSLALGRGLEKALEREWGVGRAVHSCVGAFMAEQKGGNTHLGTAMLICPLALAYSYMTERDIGRLRDALGKLLASAGAEEAEWMCRAVQLASPSHLPEAKGLDAMAKGTPEDIRDRAVSLVDWMRLGSERNLIAREYTSVFSILFDNAGPFLAREVEARGIEGAVITTYMHLLSRRQDTNVLGSCGEGVAGEVMERARGIEEGGCRAVDLADFDAWLRAKGANPGTMADLVAGALFLYIIWNDHIEDGDA